MKSHTAAAVLAVLAALFLSVSCVKQEQQHPQSRQESGGISITATFYPLYIMLMNITDNVPGVTLTLLAPAETGCLHDYQLTTQDMKTISACSIIVANGAGMEDFLEKVLEEKKDAVIIASEGYDLIDDNAHIWVSPKGASHEVRQIARGLARLDPDHAAAYTANADAYCAKLSELSARMHQTLDGFQGASIITFHEAFPYFASEFKLNTAAVIEREAGTSPSAKELAELIAVVKSHQGADGVSLFAETQYSSAAAEVIAAETGLTVYELDPAVTGIMDKDAYLTAMEKNMQVLQQALAGRR